jgi:hypothetical protein
MIKLRREGNVHVITLTNGNPMREQVIDVIYVEDFDDALAQAISGAKYNKVKLQIDLNEMENLSDILASQLSGFAVGPSLS